MTTTGWAIIIILAAGIGLFSFFIVKFKAIPQRIEALEGLLKKGKTQIVIKAAKRIIAQNSRSAEAHYYLGKAYLAENSEELAGEEFKIVNNLGISGKNIPEHEFRQTLAQIFYHQNLTEEALKEYLLLIKLAPKTGEYYYWAGKLFSERSRIDMAEKYLNKAAELCPRDGKIHYELGLMLYHDKKNREARAALERALKLSNVNVPQALFYLGKIQKDAKNFDTAIANFEKAARDASIRVRALVERGGCFLALGAPEKAIPDLERAVNSISDESAPESLYARYFLGDCYQKTRNPDKAIAQWEIIYNQKKNFRDVSERLSGYQDICADDTLKDYLTASQERFLEMCKSVATEILDLHITDFKIMPDGCEIKAVENESEKWRNTRKIPRLLRYYRSADPIQEERVRLILEDAKAENIPKTAVFSSSGFSRSAINYASSRSVELFSTEKLKEMLDKACQAKSGQQVSASAQAAHIRGKVS